MDRLPTPTRRLAPRRRPTSLVFALRAAVATVVLLSVPACAVKPAKRPYPTLDQYSDGGSRLVAAFGADLYSRDKAALEGLWPTGVSVRLASTSSAPVFESPSSLKVERFAASATAVSRDEALRLLLDRREKFIGVVHNESHLVGYRAAGDRREMRIHRLLAGPSHEGPMQEESWWTWTFVRHGPPESWEIVSAVEDRRIVVAANQPLFRQVYPEEGAPNFKASTARADERRGLAEPGLHDTGGVAVLNDCVDRKPCMLIGGGEGIAAIVSGGDEFEFSDRARLLKLDGITGEVKTILAGDFDNDGLTDLVVTFDHGRARYFKGQRYLETGDDTNEHSEHLAFVDATEGSGLEGLDGPCRGAVAFDADGDGRLDLYVVSYGDASKTGPSLDGRNGTANHLFRNVTEGGNPVHFLDVSRASGTDDTGWGLAAAAADYDGDGRVDLFVANDFGRNVLYRNVTPHGGAIRFEDVTSRAGTGDVGGAGACWGDFDGDGDLDLYVSRDGFDERWILAQPSFPMPAGSRSAAARLRRSLEERASGGVLYRNDVAAGRGFTRLKDAGVDDAGWAWGAAWLDADGDGRLDLAVANGMLTGKSADKSREADLWAEMSAGWGDFSKGSWTIDFGEDGITGAQPERLFINLGDGTFADAGYVGGFDSTADLRGLVAADVTNDAAPDLVGAAFLDSPVIYQNTNAGNPGRVRVRLESTGSNWDAAGAVVRLTAGGRTQTRIVSAGGSYLSDGGRWVDFGYGTAKEIDRVEVLWPSGLKSVLDKPSAERRTIDVTEPAKPGGLSGAAPKP